jgi:hypothetical protein
MYFMAKGKALLVLPMFGQKSYFEIMKGEHFGHADMFGRREISESLLNSKKNKGDLKRIFTCQAILPDPKMLNCELLTIQVDDLDKMRTEFAEIYESLYKDA